MSIAQRCHSKIRSSVGATYYAAADMSPLQGWGIVAFQPINMSLLRRFSLPSQRNGFYHRERAVA
jgi:hypothetical protein